MKKTSAAVGPAPVRPANNPLLEPWTAPFGMPPFADIKLEHFAPAFEFAMAQHNYELAQIAKKPASYNATIRGLEAAGQDLSRVRNVFNVLTMLNSTDALREFEREISGTLARHSVSLFQNPEIFEKVRGVYDQRGKLSSVRRRLTEEYYDHFLDSGMALDEAERARYKEMAEKLADMRTTYNQNLLKEAKEKAVIVETAEELEGVPEASLKAAARSAASLGHAGKYAIPLTPESTMDILKFAHRRDLREKVYTAYHSRCTHGDKNDNRQLAHDIVELRQTMARMIGYKNYAEKATVHNVAKTPETALGLLKELVEPAKAKYAAEMIEVTEEARLHGFTDQVKPWDWAYYSEKLRQRKYNVSEDELKPYLSLDGVRTAFFTTCKDVFGLSSSERKDVKAHHSDATVWDVRDSKGAHLGALVTDYLAREGSKRSGAWMDELRTQNGITGERGLIHNCCNYVAAGEGQPVLLSLQNAVTLFHEGGHGLHGLASKTASPGQAGTSVPRDIVELPSQFMESFLLHPLMMARNLRHHETGEPMPQELIDRVQKMLGFNQGHFILRQLSFGIPDLELYSRPAGVDFDPETFEQETLKRYDFPKDVAERPAMLPTFQHIISGGYAANYYVYMWADVMAKDAAEVFKPNPLNPALGKKMLQHIYASGNTRDPMDNFKKVFGRAPDSGALRRAYGLS